MRILWHNVFALIFSLLALALLVKCYPAITGLLSNAAAIGPGHSPDEQTLGLIAFGLVAVFFVAVIKLLTQNRK